MTQLGFHVHSIYEHSRGISDDKILTKAWQEEWIIITNDKDFGEKITREKHPHHGVIFLRLDDERKENKIKILNLVLKLHKNQIPKNFIIATENRIRLIKNTF